jgi:hypothetical protein
LLLRETNGKKMPRFERHAQSTSPAAGRFLKCDAVIPRGEAAPYRFFYDLIYGALL